jgi:hypothetical protein
MLVDAALRGWLKFGSVAEVKSIQVYSIFDPPAFVPFGMQGPSHFPAPLILLPFSVVMHMHLQTTRIIG